MLYRFFATLVVVGHFCFVVFVLGGGLLVLRRRKLALLHVPAVLWGMWVEWSGWLCPLTPLENYLRLQGGGVGYEGGFIDHYVMKILYPDGLTRQMQVVLGCTIALVNVVLYAIAFRPRRRGSRTFAGDSPAAPSMW
jgi:hypothetical protein